MMCKEVRLGWEESQKHYHALSEIEEKHLPDYIKVTKNQRKKLEAKIHNEKNDYMRRNEMVYRDGGFYITVMVNDD